jgi:hypothetical protein
MDISVINNEVIDVHFCVISMAKNKKNVDIENQDSPMRDKIRDLYEENEYLSIKQNQNRARSITVGTAFGGVVEINVRSDVASVYAQLQPTEAIELIEQLAAGVGVEIAMRPKVNFASWRGWEEIPDQGNQIEKIFFKDSTPEQIGKSYENESKKLLLPENSKSKKVSSRKKLNSKKEILND